MGHTKLRLFDKIPGKSC